MTTGPREGDLVRAVEDSREATVVEGVLRLRLVPSLDYVQVHVIGPPGCFWSVDPASVEVIDPEVAFVPDDELEDPLRDQPGWRRITDLHAAMAEGLVPPATKRNLTWSEMESRLDKLVSVMVEAGWVAGTIDHASDNQFGDCVIIDLWRGDDMLLFEYYDDDLLLVWPTNPGDDEDADPPDALCEVDGPSAEVCRPVFAELGWIQAV